MLSINSLINSYTNFIQESMSIEEIHNKLYSVETPFLDRKNDFITIYIKINKEQIELTDNGETILDLELSGMHFNTPKRKEELNFVLNGHSIRINRGTKELLTIANSTTFAQKFHSLIQAIISVNDMFVLTENKVKNLFFEDVGQYFNENDIRFSSNMNIEGRSRLLHKFEYVIPHSRSYNERLVRLSNNPKLENVKAILFSFEDIRGVRESIDYIFFNDMQNRVQDEFIQAVREYNIKPVLWSQKDMYLSELAG
ncbi:MAG: DUF1828 domain-containing protein [Campylobacteraceae bacterium]